MKTDIRTDMNHERRKRPRIAIGVYREKEGYDEKVYRAADSVKPLNFSVVVVDEGDETEKVLMELLERGEVDAAVRGTARASVLIPKLRKYGKIARLALLETAEGKRFILAPVGVDEGETLTDRIFLAEEGVRLAAKLGLQTRIAILSGGRKSDLGRSQRVDRTLAEGEFLATHLSEKGYAARHYGIVIEEAVKEADVIIAPDGISGNLIFRSLCLVGRGIEHGAPVVGLPFIFVDTSRAQSHEGYVRALKLAAKLASGEVDEGVS